MKKALSLEPDGVAIAAPQIGASLRMFVVAGKIFSLPSKKKIKKKENIPDRLFINPEIVKLSKEKEMMEEGCLSVRYRYGHVSRFKKTRIRALDEKGKVFEFGASGLLAQIFQHEMDHLEGVLFIDKASDMIELTKEEYAKQNK